MTNPIFDAIEHDPASKAKKVTIIPGGGSGGQSDFSQRYASTNLYTSPEDFTASYNSSTQLTLSGLSFTPSNEQFIAVIEYPSSGSPIVYPYTDHQFSYSAGTLTVSGANFSSTSTFVVLIHGQKKSYDEVSNAIRILEQNRPHDQPGYGEFVDVTALAIGTYYYPSSDGLLFDGYKGLAVQFLIDGGYDTTNAVAGSVDLVVEATLDDATSPDWINITNLGRLSSGISLTANDTIQSVGNSSDSGDEVNGIIQFDVLNVKKFRVRVDVATYAADVVKIHHREIKV